jgi:uncharacterized Zn finger protein (UPF0148 family)
LRCDDAERDPRVNREVCRELGIASVIVMPIVGDEQVLGIFELLSGKPRAFDERDLSALLRLSEMVEAAVKHALPAQIAPSLHDVAVAESQPLEAERVVEEEINTPQPEPVVLEPLAPEPLVTQPLTASAVSSEPAPALAPPAVPPQETPPAKEIAEPAAGKKPLFWSAALRAQGSEPPKQNAESSAVPPVLRNFQKCQACGFPVSQGRTFCVECEEKQWRGQRIAQAKLPQQPNQLQSPESKRPVPDENVQDILIEDSHSDQLSMPLVAESEVATPAPEPEAPKAPQELKTIIPAAVEVASTPQTLAATTSPSSSDAGGNAPADALSSNEAALFLSSAIPSESWFASNKYVLVALFVVAIVIGAIAWLR